MVTVENPNNISEKSAVWKQRAFVYSIILGSSLATLVAFWFIGRMIVAIFYVPPEATFQMAKRLIIPPVTPEHKMNLARHDAMAPKPSFQKRLVSIRPIAFALPDFADVELDVAMPVDPSQMALSNASTLVGRAGLGAGFSQSARSGVKGTGLAGVGFFGIEDKARSFVIMIDISDSMFGRTGDYDYKARAKTRFGKEQSFQAIRDEAYKLIDGLNIDSRFGIIKWAGGAYSWKPELIRATDSNKQTAKEWIQTQVDIKKAKKHKGQSGGTRHDLALKKLFTLKPEVAFMLTDGNATRTSSGKKNIPPKELYEIIKEAKNNQETIPRVHTIYYLTGKDKKEEEKMLRGIARKTDGKFRKVKARKRKNRR